MKKWTLFLMVTISFSCLGSIQGKAGVCPSERPLLNGGTWKNENCPNLKNIHDMYELPLYNFPNWEEIPAPVSFPDMTERDKDLYQKILNIYKEKPKTTSKKGKTSLDDATRDLDSLRKENWKRRDWETSIVDTLRLACTQNKEEETICNKLDDIKERLRRASIEIEILEGEIQWDNSSIKNINQIFKEKNNSLREKKETINGTLDRCRVSSKSEKIPFHTHEPIIVHNGYYGFKGGLLRSYVDILDRIIKSRSAEIKEVRNEYQHQQSDSLYNLARNMKIEKENNAIVSEFEKFYTPEREKQLLAEYEKALAEKCVGCDYLEPLDVQKESCDLCLNREYVDGKCVLKKDKK